MKRTSIKCEMCNKEISKSNYTKHIKKCNGIIELSDISIEILEKSSKIVKEYEKYKCLICGKIYTMRGISTHFWRSHPIDGQVNNHKGGAGWNTGLKVSDETRKNISESGKGRAAWNKGIIGLQHHTDEMKEHLSRVRSKFLEENATRGGFKYVKYYKVSNIEDEEFSVRGTWELQFVEWLNSNRVLWKRKIYLPYILNGLKKTYTPDFYAERDNIYFEVKGYFSEKDKIKMKLVEENNTDAKFIIIDNKIISNLKNLKYEDVLDL
jgi:hypothetical protein